MAVCLVALGSNVGDSGAALDAACTSLASLSDADLHASQRVLTPPVGGPAGQSPYLNAVVEIQTACSPHDLFARLQAIQQEAGRRSGIRWDARPLDVDLLTYDGAIINEPHLRVPHPRMSFRPFVIRPAAELTGDWAHPELGATLSEIAAAVADPAPLVVVVGAGEVAERCTREATRRVPSGVAVRHAPAGGGLPASPAGLTIDATSEGVVARGPRLRVADCDDGRLTEEIHAAVECLWPAASPPPG